MLVVPYLCLSHSNKNKKTLIYLYFLALTIPDIEPQFQSAPLLAYMSHGTG
jgi:hypothetical protein